MKICPICVVVSGTWLLFSGGIAWGYLSPQNLIIPISLLMGGSVVGVMSMVENKLSNKLAWKFAGISLGMVLAYTAVTNISKATVLIELIVLLLIAFLFFIKQGSGNTSHVREIEKQMEDCC